MQISPWFYELELPEPVLISELIVLGHFTSNAVEVPDHVAPAFTKVSARLIHFFEESSAEQAVDQMAANGFRQASFIELLCFAIKYPEEGRDVWIAALGSVLQDWDGYNHIPIVRYDKLARRLGYWRRESGFSGRVHLLAIVT